MLQNQLVDEQEQYVDLVELINGVKAAAEGTSGIVQERISLDAGQITELNSLLGTSIPAPSGPTRDIYLGYHP